MKKLRYLLTLLLGLCLAVTSVTASGGTQTSTAAPLRWLCVGDSGARPMVSNDRIISGINEKLGILLNVEIVPQASYERINLAMASGDFPDIVTGEYGAAATQSWIDNGVIIALNPYFNTYANIKNWLQNDYPWDTDIKGDFYGIPFITQYNRANALITTRSDWLAKIGMRYPTTLDEFKAMLMAYVYNDPNGTGKADTI